jgi:predicted nuclease with TOPRIM domain
MAAEEDKRRRNTAASARFRVKKKQREQALEQTAKELENKVNGLEQRIGQLETENEWLRGLVVEKNGGEKNDLKIKWKKLRGCGGEEGERKGGEGKRGVGTSTTSDED